MEQINGIAALTNVEVKYIWIGDITPAQKEAMEALRFGSFQLIEAGPTKYHVKIKNGLITKEKEKHISPKALVDQNERKSFRNTQATIGALANLKSGSGIASLLKAPRLTDRKEPLADLPVCESLPHPEGEFWITDNVNQYVSRPKGLQENGRAYALYVVGHNAEPRFKQGEIIVVDPNRPPAIRDNVVVRWKSDEDDDPGHKACIGWLLFQDSKEVVIARFKDGLEEVSIGANKVEAIFRIMPWNEVLGW